MKKEQIYTNKKYFFYDYIILSLFTIFITLQPYFQHGDINFYETGFYLPVINALSHGQVLFKDVFVLRGPLEIFIPALLMKCFGKHIVYLYLYFYIGAIITLLLYILSSFLLFRSRIFLYFFTFVFVARIFPRVAFNNWGGLRFSFGILAIIFALMFFKHKKYIWILLAGLSSGIGFFLSPEIGIYSALSIIITLFFYGIFLKKLNYSFKIISFFLLGIFVVSVPFLIYLLINQAFCPYLETNLIVWTKQGVTFDPAYYTSIPRSFKALLLALIPGHHNFKHLTPFYFYLGVSIYFIWKLVNKKVKERDFNILSLFFYGILMYIGTFRNLEGHQFEMALQPEKILLFLFLEKIYFYLKTPSIFLNRKRVANFAFIFFIIIMCSSFGYSIQRFNHRFFMFKWIRNKLLGRNTEELLPYSTEDSCALNIKRARNTIVSCKQNKEIEGTVNFIFKNIPPQESIFTFPSLGTYNFLADRLCTDRFCMAEFSWMSESWHKELIADLKKKRPTFTILKKDLKELQPFFKREKNKIYFNELLEFIHKNYREIYTSGNIAIMKSYTNHR